MELLNYVDGALQPGLDSAWLEVWEPATGRVYAQAPASSSRDVQLAVQAAHNAFGKWAALAPQERADHLLCIAQAMEDRLEELAQLESRDNGKPVSLARRVDIPRAVSNFRFFATAILHTEQEAHATTLPAAQGGAQALNYTLRQPLGAVAAISPWNLPLYLFTWKIAPALASGCTVVAKPSEITPATAALLGEICREAGLPRGVLNILHGYGPDVGEPLVKHNLIKAVTFTGGTQTGVRIAQQLAPQLKKSSLELGGKNPYLVFADADYEQALETAVRAAFSNQGQICLCGSRLYIQQELYERFRDDFVARVEALQVGDPQDPATDQGALVSQAHYQKVLSYLLLAQQEGGRVLTGGKPLTLEGRCADGWFIQPTVLEGLPHTCRTNQEEIFGPVCTLEPFRDEKDALVKANGVVYGLAASLWTRDLQRAHRLAQHLQAGIVWVNCWMLRDLRTPFGGMKSSGLGREGGRYALEFFTEPKNVCIGL